jgi:hypothetical protein
LLDSVTLMRSALSDEYASLKKLRALDQLWEGSLLLLTSLEGTFLPQGAAKAEEPDAEEMSRWERRLDKALAQFRSAGIATADRADALKAYAASRSQWDGHARRLAPSMQYPMQEIDRVTDGSAKAQQADVNGRRAGHAHPAGELRRGVSRGKETRHSSGNGAG